MGNNNINKHVTKLYPPFTANYSVKEPLTNRMAPFLALQLLILMY